MSPLVRSGAEELLDDPGRHPAELAESLEQVAQVNRLFGGTRSLRVHLDRFAGDAHLRLLDVGTGNGRLAESLVRWAATRGGRWHLTGLELHEAVIQVARLGPLGRGAGFTLVRGDALALPFCDGAFDVVCCTLTLHHFRDEDAVRLVSELGRVARRTVLVSELERHRLAYLSARVLARTLWRRNRVTRHDGPLSVLRAFTPTELLEIGRRGGLREPRVRRHFPFRLVLEGGPGTGGPTGERG